MLPRNPSDLEKAMIEIDSRAFRRAVHLAGKAAAARTNVPVLEALHCHANGRLEISGTDMDQMLTVTIDREGRHHGSFLLPGHARLSKMLAALGGEAMKIVPKNDEVRVSSGEFEARIDSKIDPVDFPQHLRIDEGVTEHWSATIGIEHLEGLARILFAISTEETRYYLNGVFLQARGNWGYRAWATDGHRLAWFDMQLPDAKGQLPGNVIIPRANITLLLKSLTKPESGFRVSVGGGLKANSEPTLAPDRIGNRISFCGTVAGMDVALRSKLIDGTYPDVSRVVPANVEHQAMFDVRDLRRAVQACVAGERKPPAIKFEFRKDAGVRVSTEWVVLGLHASTVIPCQHSYGDATVGINGRYIMDVLASARGDKLAFASDSQPTVAPVMMQDPADDLWGVVVMPVRV